MSNPDPYARLHGDFAWNVPGKFNIAQVCLHRWARDTPAAVAIIQDAGDGAPIPYTYAALQRDARRLSNALGSLGVTRGDRVAIVMPQRPQTAVALMAVFQMGAIAVPLSVLFGAEALQARLNDSGAKVALVDEASAEAIEALRDAARTREGASLRRAEDPAAREHRDDARDLHARRQHRGHARCRRQARLRPAR